MLNCTHSESALQPLPYKGAVNLNFGQSSSGMQRKNGATYAHVIHCVCCCGSAGRWQTLVDCSGSCQAVLMLEDGSTQRLVTQRLGVSRNVVGRLWIRYQEMDGYTRRPGQGCQRCTTAREDRYLATCALRNRFATDRQLQYDL